jgi:cytochrome P450
VDRRRGVFDEGVSRAFQKCCHTLPFSRGLRSCVGKGLAYHEISLALAPIIHRFDFCRLDKEGAQSVLQVNESEGKQEFLLRDHITGAKAGLFLRFTLREE